MGAPPFCSSSIYLLVYTSAPLPTQQPAGLPGHLQQPRTKVRPHPNNYPSWDPHGAQPSPLLQPQLPLGLHLLWVTLTCLLISHTPQPDRLLWCLQQPRTRPSCLPGSLSFRQSVRKCVRTSLTQAHRRHALTRDTGALSPIRDGIASLLEGLL